MDYEVTEHGSGWRHSVSVSSATAVSGRQPWLEPT